MVGVGGGGGGGGRREGASSEGQSTDTNPGVSFKKT